MVCLNFVAPDQKCIGYHQIYSERGLVSIFDIRYSTLEVVNPHYS